MPRLGRITVESLACTAVLGLGSAAAADLESCLQATLRLFGGEAWHVEFESRGGRPTYEFVVAKGNERLYVGCDAGTGRVGEVDAIVEADDPRWRAVAKIEEEKAVAIATERYRGEVEEVKRLLLGSGGAAYEVDVEVEGGEGEFNVYVDAETGRILNVHIEYWEIGRPSRQDDDD